MPIPGAPHPTGTQPGPAQAEAIVAGCRPTSDAAAVAEIGTRLHALADRLSEMATDVAMLFRGLDAGEGRFYRAALEGGDRLLGVAAHEAGGRDALWEPQTGSAGPHVGLLGASTAMRDAAVALTRFANLTASTQQRVDLIAAIADRDRMLGDLAASLGDDTLAVTAASAGRLALTAAGDDYADQSADAASADSTSAATSGMMPMAGFAGLGSAAMAAGGAATTGGRSTRRRDGESEAGLTDHEPRELTRGECAALAARVSAVQASLAGGASSWVQIALGVGEHPRTGRVMVFGTSDPVPYVRVGMTLRLGEQLAGDGRDPEIALLDHMARAGVVPMAVASSRPPSPAARAVLVAAGVRALVAGS